MHLMNVGNDNVRCFPLSMGERPTEINSVCVCVCVPGVCVCVCVCVCVFERENPSSSSPSVMNRAYQFGGMNHDKQRSQ